MKQQLQSLFLDNSIEFEEMGGMDGTVDVEIVLALVVSDPKVHLSFLQKKLMGMFQEKKKPYFA
ncbi:hypothetical protein GCM10020331_053570 [Ectobacillus funiculus]